MYSEHKNAGKGRVMLGETFKELRQQILHSSRLTHGKTINCLNLFASAILKSSPRIWIKSSLLLDVKTRYSIQ